MELNVPQQPEQTAETIKISFKLRLEVFIMALTMYMKVTGKNQGEIKGSCDQGGDKKDKILV